MAATTQEKFDAAVRVIHSIPKNGKTSYRVIYIRHSFMRYVSFSGMSIFQFVCVVFLEHKLQCPGHHRLDPC